MKKVTYAVIGFIILNIITTIIGVSMFFSKFVPNIPEANFPAPATQLEAHAQDVDYLRQFTSIDNSFSSEEQHAFAASLDQIESLAGQLTDAQFAMKISKAVALSDNGHTNVRFANLADNFNSLPVRFFWFADGLHIVRAHEDRSRLIGAKVLEYDGKPPETLVAALKPYHGGNAAYVRFRSPYFLSAPELMHAINLADNSDRVTLKLALPSGELDTVEVTAETVQTETLSLRDYPLSKQAKEEAESGNDWAYLEGTKTTKTHYGRFPEKQFWKTHYGRFPEKQFWTETLPGGGIYIRIRLIFNKGDEKLGPWLRTLQATYSETPAKYLVLDLRSNPGGDYMISRDFARKIAAMVAPDGRIYTLTDGGTFSAAVVTAAFVKHTAAEQGRFVGSPMGDDEQFWAEGGKSMLLPNSKIRASVSTGFHDWENGCKNWNKCYWVNIVLGVAAGKFETDIEAPLSFADYINGVDTSMEAVYREEGVTR